MNFAQQEGSGRLASIAVVRSRNEWESVRIVDEDLGYLIDNWRPRLG